MAVRRAERFADTLRNKYQIVQSRQKTDHGRTRWYGPRMTTMPASERAYTRLADTIRRGMYTPGGRLPGERALAESLEVSRVTVRKALARLQAEGSLVASCKQGWFVPSNTGSQPPTVLQSFTEMANARGLRATSQILNASVRPATLDEAARLCIAPAEDVFFLERLRGMSGQPLCLDRSTMPLAMVEPLAQADLTDRSLYETLGSLCGIEIYRSSYSVLAEAADERVAQLLEVPQGSPLLISAETAYMRDDVPVVLGNAMHRGDAYRFEADLFRPQV